MGLINLQTDLKSLKFGKDRPGGGNSGQPFIQTPIPDNQSDSTPLSVYDSLLRGGVQAPQRALTDVKRLTKYLFNPKSPSGLLFITKENLLSRTSVKTEASTGPAYAGGNINAGVYSPLNTLAQAGVGYLGIHLNQKGIDPTGLSPLLSLNKYENVVKNKPVIDNRLINLFKENQLFSNNNSNVLEYNGGPGSTLGVGKTRIKFADQRTGVNNLLAKSTESLQKYFYKGGIRLHPTDTEETNLLLLSIGKQPLDNSTGFNYKNYLGASTSQGLDPLSDNNITLSGKLINSPYKEIGSNLIEPISPDITYNKIIQNQVSLPKDDTTYIFDTYKKTRLAKLYGGNGDFAQLNIESRVNLGDPGTTKGSYTEPLDKINASALYSTSGSIGRNSGEYNDLVSFRIGIIDPNEPKGNVTYMNFRSFIDSFSDSYNSDWKAQSYMGRGEKFYKYGGFDRSISMAFTVVAQSMGEMRGMYQKLNYLASSLAPTYTPQGYMAGNICKMTVGDYIFEQYGFISSITYDVPQDSSWDLSLNPQNLEISRDDLNPDKLPFMIKVTGLKFTPIHNFRPEIVGDINTPKPTQRYITNDLNLKGYDAIV
jgi:hypothetical protein